MRQVDRPLRCAVLSVIKHDYVARGIASHPEFQLTVVADDADQPQWAHERNQQFADEFGIPYVRDVEQAFRDWQVDVAIVSSAAERHCELSIKAARAGVHIVQDKPIGTRPEDVRQLVHEISKTDVRFLLWNRNFFPAVQHAARKVADGSLGDIRAIHVDFYFAKDAGPPRGSRKPGYPPIDWLAYQLGAHVDGSDGAVGHDPIGELTNEGIYPLGYMRLLTGRDVRRVYASTTTHFHQVNDDNGVEDLASVTLEMQDGIIGTIAVGRIGASSHPSGGEIKLHIVGSRGAMVVNEASPDVGIYYRNQPPKEARRRRVANENDLLLADDFARAIRRNTSTILNERDGHHIFRVIEAALQSAAAGQPVDVV